VPLWALPVTTVGGSGYESKLVETIPVGSAGAGKIDPTLMPGPALLYAGMAVSPQTSPAFSATGYGLSVLGGASPAWTTVTGGLEITVPIQFGVAGFRIEISCSANLVVSRGYVELAIIDSMGTNDLLETQHYMSDRTALMAFDARTQYTIPAGHDGAQTIRIRLAPDNTYHLQLGGSGVISVSVYNR
jgi:hypothetical protein